MATQLIASSPIAKQIATFTNRSLAMFKRIYIRFVKATGRLMELVGVVAILKRFPNSNFAKYLISLFYIYDFKQMIALDLAWWNFKTIKRVEKFLANKKNAEVFEYGSGASTIWLSKRAGRVVSVESDGEFYQQVHDYTRDKQNVKLILREPSQQDSATFGSKKQGFENLNFETFVKEIEQHKDFDLIIIDGRAREICLDYALKHLRPQGMILFDDTSRKRYLDKINQTLDIQVEHLKGFCPSIPYPTVSTLITRKD
jgi:predicted O-methyltransferase YrrM